MLQYYGGKWERKSVGSFRIDGDQLTNSRGTFAMKFSGMGQWTLNAGEVGPLVYDFVPAGIVINTDFGK